jgi:hypothetical protein
MERAGTGLRVVRAGLFAALCVTMSTTSHILLSRSPLPLPVVAGAVAAIFTLAYLLGGGQERGFWPIAALMVPLELATDTVFTAGQQACYGPSGGPVTGSWWSFHEAFLCSGGQVGTKLSAVPGGAAAPALPCTALPWLLLAVHVAVGLAASWWLRRGEAALHRVLRVVAAAAFRPLRLATAARAVPASSARRPHRPARTAAAAVATRPLQHAVVRRGPPVLAAA